MDKLSNLVRQINEFGGKKMFKETDIRVWPPGYIDERTIYDVDQNIHIVRPVVFMDDYYHYICPRCTEIHAVHKLKANRQIRTGCCASGRRSSRHCIINGELVRIKDQKIILNTKI